MSARGAGANQPPVVVDSNPATLMTNKPRTLSGTGLVHQGSFEVVELAGTLPSFLAVYRSVRLTTQTYGGLMLHFRYNPDKLHFQARRRLLY